MEEKTHAYQRVSRKMMNNGCNYDTMCNMFTNHWVLNDHILQKIKKYQELYTVNYTLINECSLLMKSIGL